MVRIAVSYVRAGLRPPERLARRVDPIHRFEVARSQCPGVQSLRNPRAATVWLQILWMPVPSRCDGHHEKDDD